MKNKKDIRPKREIKAFVNKKTTKEKGRDTNKRVNNLNIKTKEL